MTILSNSASAFAGAAIGILVAIQFLNTGTLEETVNEPIQNLREPPACDVPTPPKCPICEEVEELPEIEDKSFKVCSNNEQNEIIKNLVTRANIPRNFKAKIIVFYHVSKTGGQSRQLYMKKVGRTNYSINLINIAAPIEKLKGMIQKDKVNVIVSHMAHINYFDQVQEVYPEAEFIFHMRNPIERVYSAYYYHLTRGKLMDGYVRPFTNELWYLLPYANKHLSRTYYYCDDGNYSINGLSFRFKDISRSGFSKNERGDDESLQIPYSIIKKLGKIVTYELKLYNVMCGTSYIHDLELDCDAPNWLKKRQT